MVAASDSIDYTTSVRDFFDIQYREHRRYWWSTENRYCLDREQHTAFHAAVLRLAATASRGRVLDIGAGEGADSIRLAKLGFQVDAIELSAVACEKLERFARSQRVLINIRNESIQQVELASSAYDLVVMNGVLHYVREKEEVLTRVRRASADGALHVVSLFSDATELPAEHAAVPTFPDREVGVVERFYSRDGSLYSACERSKPETSHPGFPPHVHSHIKIIKRLTI